MAYPIPDDPFTGLAQQPGATYSHMEPETVTRDSDDSSVGSTSTPGDRGRGHDGAGGHLKRATSSPNVRGLGVEGIPMSAADKKRNKLGYHRTAVACGHCRRRKIRCIPAFEDSSGRCQNCIRLKKECHFFPVDQQTLPAARRSRTASKADTVVTEHDISGSSSEQGGPPVLKSSPEEGVRYNPNGLARSPLSPHELSGFPNYDYIQPPDRISVSQGYNPVIPTQTTHLQLNPEAVRSQNQYFSPMSAQMMTSPLHASPQTTAYPSLRQTTGGEAHWPHTASTTSMSSMGSEEAFNPYAAYRAQSYPLNFRRASEPQHLSFGYREGSGYGQDSVSRQYQDNAAYAASGYNAPMTSDAARMPASTSAAYSTAWYPSHGALPYLREEDDHSSQYARNQP